jgi:hypothetical protein
MAAGRRAAKRFAGLGSICEDGNRLPWRPGLRNRRYPLRKAEKERLILSVMPLGEICKGIDLLPATNGSRCETGSRSMCVPAPPRTPDFAPRTVLPATNQCPYDCGTRTSDLLVSFVHGILGRDIEIVVAVCMLRVAEKADPRHLGATRCASPGL